MNIIAEKYRANNCQRGGEMTCVTWREPSRSRSVFYNAPAASSIIFDIPRIIALATGAAGKNNLSHFHQGHVDAVHPTSIILDSSSETWLYERRWGSSLPFYFFLSLSYLSLFLFLGISYFNELNYHEFQNLTARILARVEAKSIATSKPMDVAVSWGRRSLVVLLRVQVMYESNNSFPIAKPV